MTTSSKTIQLNSHYHSAFTDKSFVRLVFGAAGAGKSYTMHQQEIIHAMMSKKRILFCRKVANTLKDSCFYLVKKLISDMGMIEGYHYKKNETRNYIRFRNGSEFLMYGLDKPEKLLSVSSIDRVLIEEAAQTKEDDFQLISHRLRGLDTPDPQITLIMNPVSIHHWTKKRFIDNPHVDNPFVLRTTYKHNLRWLGEDSKFVKSLENMKNYDPEYYKIYALGEWGDPSGDIIYRNWEVVKESEFDKIWGDEFYGLDLGFVHPLALVHCKYVEGKVYVKQLIHRSGIRSDQVFDIIDSLDINRSTPIYVDSAYPAEIATLVSRGYSAFKASKDVDAGIRFVRRFDLKITDNSGGVIKEIEEYRFAKNPQNDIIEVPIKFNDDAMDAMRYAIYTHLKYKVNYE